MSSQPTALSPSNQADRRNACPGLTRMVLARDGAMARIKLPMGRISTDRLLALAAIAERFGPGAVELSIRSNVQLRGIAPERWEEAVVALYDAGFGADDPAADDIRNVMVSPTAGIDAGQSCNIVPLARALLARLEATEAWHALSPKFSFQIDGGEHCAMIAHPGDIWLSAMDDGEHFAFGLASAPSQPALGMVAVVDVLPLIDAILHLFLRLRPAGTARIKQLFETLSAERFVAELAASVPIVPANSWRRTPSRPFAHLGRHKQTNEHFYIGAMPLLGRLTATQLRELAAMAQDEIRLTPWQGVILSDLDADRCDVIEGTLRAIGLATAPDAPQARLRACTGMSGCASALSDTQADAKALAAYLEPNTAAVHLTGCTKSCAALAPLPYTLLARSPGRYDVFSRDGTGPSRFGRLLATDIAIDRAARLLNQEPES